MSSNRYLIAFYRGSVHAVADVRRLRPGGLETVGASSGPAPHPGVIEVAATLADFAPASDGSSDLENVGELRVTFHDKPGTTVYVGGFAVFAPEHRPNDAPLYAAPLAEHIRVEGGYYEPVLELPAGALRIPASVAEAALT